MALSLNAEQKCIKDLFLGDFFYTIPLYQREYSWEYDQCYQLYNDINSAFGAREEYFLGNIILAMADNDKRHYQVVDGQQRIITLWIFLKVLSLFRKDITFIERLLTVESWKGDDKDCKIQFGDNKEEQNKYKSKDSEAIEYLSSVTLNELDENAPIRESLQDSKIVKNARSFYTLLSELKSNIPEDEFEDYVSFVLQSVFLLPISLNGTNIEEASQKALVIFETINNRGMNLCDADIFKARLFNDAKKRDEASEFMAKWQDVIDSADALNYSIDDIFRFYYHILRGRLGLSSFEKEMRLFFLTDSESPIRKGHSDEIIADLQSICSILDTLRLETEKSTDAGMWLKVLQAYSNNYPMLAVVNFMYVNGVKIDRRLERFLEHLVRMSYIRGASTTVKFDIYNLIKATTAGCVRFGMKPIDPDIEWMKTPPVRLRKGLALLCYVLEGKEGVKSYLLDKIITGYNTSYWIAQNNTAERITEVSKQLGNFVIAQSSALRATLPEKLKKYKEMTCGDVLNGKTSLKAVEERTARQFELLQNFFCFKVK